MRAKIELSIIIATRNSNRTLPLVLRSVAKQTYPKKNIECLVVDGASTDGTIQTARKHRCRILRNPRIVPAWAKFIGYKEAKGKYLMYLDSDEVIERPDSIQRKVTAFNKFRGVHAVAGSGYVNPEGCSMLNRYINEFGDPFSFFIYRLSKDERFFLPAMQARYHAVQDTKDYSVFNFSNVAELPIFELVAMGSMIDREYVKKLFPAINKTPGFIPHMFYLMVSKGANIGIVKDDALVHYSATSVAGYLAKIRSRVISNVFTPATEGFRGRSKLGSAPGYKKYLFLPYAFTIVFPLWDALVLAVTRRHAGYILHVPLTLYTAVAILYYTLARTVGLTYKVKQYG